MPGASTLTDRPAIDAMICRGKESGFLCQLTLSARKVAIQPDSVFAQDMQNTATHEHFRP